MLLQEPEPRVVTAAQRGDLHAFETLVRLYQPYVWRLCFHMLRDEGVAADVTQETFLKTFRAIRRFKGRSKFSTWLISITRNCIQDELRKGARRGRISIAARETVEPAGVRDGTVGVEVQEALLELPLELREAAVLIDMLGFSYREAADTLGIHEGTLKSRVHRARAALVRMLTPGQEDAREI